MPQNGRGETVPDHANLRKTISTLLVPFSIGSELQIAVQKAEDAFSGLLGAPRVRVVEKGGDTLINLLGRNDPWASKDRCPDPACTVCNSRPWLQQQKKEAMKGGQKLPKELVKETSTLCTREAANYCLQCLPCLHLGRQATYRGETSRSVRQCGEKHT